MVICKNVNAFKRVTTNEDSYIDCCGHRDLKFSLPVKYFPTVFVSIVYSVIDMIYFYLINKKCLHFLRLCARNYNSLLLIVEKAVEKYHGKIKIVKVILGLNYAIFIKYAVSVNKTTVFYNNIFRQQGN